VQARIGSSSGFVLVQVRDLVLVVGLESLQEVSLLGVLPLVLNTGMGGVVDSRWRVGSSMVLFSWFWSSSW
jgi:flagellar biogenesis protein FliO